MEIVQERLEREFDNLITTAPTVVYEVRWATAPWSRSPSSQAARPLQDGGGARADHQGHDLPAPGVCGSVITLCNQKRAPRTCSTTAQQLIYDMPMNEVVMDFFDKLKSVSRGYASLDYEFKEYRAADW
jgi:GTP-binding protein LepA